MRRIVWRSKARRDFREAIGFLAERDPPSARSLEQKVKAAALKLARHPSGRPGRIPEVFEKPVSGTFYTIVYALSADELFLLRFIHQRRDWPVGEWPED